MQNDFSVRTATFEDITSLARIENQVHISPWSEENFQSELEKPYSHTLVLSDDDTDSILAGYIVYWLMFDECEILNVAIDLPYRGLGFAEKLIRTVVTAVMKLGLKRVILDVRKSNLPAIHLYQKVGFNIVHVRKSFYSNGEDAYQMVLNFNESGTEF
jgi:ribosomal-protein-alanine N-acetyltransferase